MEAALKGSQRDRLHHHLADRLADRGADPAAVHGRGGRAPVPRIRGDARGHHRHFGLRLADAGADDVRAADPPSPGQRARPVRPRRRARLQPDHRGLCPRARRGAAASAADPVGRHRHAGAHRLALHRHPEGLLPVAGHRHHPGHFRRAAGCLVQGDGRACRASWPRSCSTTATSPRSPPSSGSTAPT